MNDLEAFKSDANLIVTNRLYDDIRDVEEKVFMRELFELDDACQIEGAQCSWRDAKGFRCQRLAAEPASASCAIIEAVILGKSLKFLN